MGYLIISIIHKYIIFYYNINMVVYISNHGFVLHEKEMAARQTVSAKHNHINNDIKNESRKMI